MTVHLEFIKGNKANQTIMLGKKTHFPSQFCKILQGSQRVTRTELLSRFLSVSLNFHPHQEMHQSHETGWQFNIRRRFHLPRYRSALAGWGLVNWKRTHVSCCCHICHTLGHTFGGGVGGGGVSELLITTFIIILQVSNNVLCPTKT